MRDEVRQLEDRRRAVAQLASADAVALPGDAVDYLALATETPLALAGALPPDVLVEDTDGGMSLDELPHAVLQVEDSNSSAERRACHPAW